MRFQVGHFYYSIAFNHQKSLVRSISRFILFLYCCRPFLTNGPPRDFGLLHSFPNQGLSARKFAFVSNQSNRNLMRWYHTSSSLECSSQVYKEEECCCQSEDSVHPQIFMQSGFFIQDEHHILLACSNSISHRLRGRDSLPVSLVGHKLHPQRPGRFQLQSWRC